jgi:phospholipid/cholesterol/gamma-HCH transport system permease protein
MIASHLSYLRLVADLAESSISVLFRRSSVSFSEVMAQIRAIGVGAIPTTVLISITAGYVLALVLVLQLSQIGKADIVPSMLWIILTEQVVPVGVALVFTGRSVSAVTAELGAMQISEEIKALFTMGIDVVPFLLLPRLIGFQLMLPAVTVISIYASLFGGWLLCGSVLKMSLDGYVYYAMNGARFSSVLIAIVKSALFAFLIATIAFYKGLNVRNGSHEISQATTQSVVTGVVVVTMANAIVTTFQLITR